MSKREKTTKARYFAVRLNPETSPLDKDMLGVVDGLMTEGFSFKAIVQDAVLRASGFRPEMYSRFTTGISLTDVQALLEGFATEILGEIKRGGFTKTLPADEEDVGFEGENVSPFAARFAKSFLERQKQTRGDED